MKFLREPTTELPMGFRIWPVSGPLAMETPHTHSDLELNFVSKGSLRYRHGGVDRTLKAGDLGMFWGGIPHQALNSEAVQGTWLTLPILWLLRWGVPGHLENRLLAGQMLKVKSDEARFSRWLQDFASGQPARMRALHLELEATFQRLSLSPALRGARSLPRGAVPGRGTLRLEQVTQYLAVNYREPLSLTKIAGAVSVHPKYLARAFKAHCGLSVWSYLTRLRVAHAQRLLRTTDLKIIDVALESGFGSVAPFYAAFERYGDARNPRSFRQQNALA